MTTIGEDVLLPMLDYETGRLNDRLPERDAAAALGGAVLTDLALANRIDTDLARLFVVDPAPLGEPLLDRALDRVAADGEHRPAAHWIGVFANEFESVFAALIERLVARGIAIRRRYGVIWIVGVHRDSGEDGGPSRDVRRRIAATLLFDEIPDPRDIAIVALAEARGLWPGLIDPPSLARPRPRIETLARTDQIGREVARAIRANRDGG